MTYSDIMHLDKRRLGITLTDALFAEPAPSDRHNPALRWKVFGRVLFWLMDQGCWLKMEAEPHRRDWFVAVRVGERWAGMRGSTLMIAGCRTALMAYHQAWPPAITAADAEQGHDYRRLFGIEQLKCGDT